MSPLYTSPYTASLKAVVSLLPEEPGIYQYFDLSGTIIYIGKAKNLRKRVSSYFSKTPENRKTALLVRNIASIQHLVVDSEEDALLLENNLIKKYKPRYNIRLKDDKTYPWICIKRERFPRVFKTRQVVRDGSEYFGPFTSWLTVTTLLELFQKLYRLRTCKYRLSAENIAKGSIRLCLEYHIGNCSGPCEQMVSEAEYTQAITEIRDILKGNISGVIRQLKQVMRQYAAGYRYEEAQIIKEKMSALEKYNSKSTVVSNTITDVDVYSIDSVEKLAIVNYLKIIRGAIVQTYSMELKKQLDESDQDLLVMGIVEIRQKIYSNAREILVPFKPDFTLRNVKFHVPQKGDKLKLLELSYRNARNLRIEKENETRITGDTHSRSRILDTLRKDLQMKEIPVRIECFDNSNLQGSHPVAACVVFLDGKPAKKEYRHFNIKSVTGANDYASMDEIITRRYSRLLSEQAELPQLIVIDGGKGQLSSATKALERLDLRGKITIIGIAKRLEEIYFPDDQIPLFLDKKSESLKLIQHLRDEAHRFGITFHRLKRSSGMLQSELTTITGIGESTANRLLRTFKSVAHIRSLPLKELAADIGEYRAKLVYDHFHPSGIQNRDQAI